MTLKLRRNYPIVALLFAYLLFLALAIGNQPIIAYLAS